MSESKEKETSAPRLEVHDVYQLRGQAAGVLSRLESAFTLLAQQGDQKGARLAVVAAEREAEILGDRLAEVLKGKGERNDRG